MKGRKPGELRIKEAAEHEENINRNIEIIIRHTELIPHQEVTALLTDHILHRGVTVHHQDLIHLLHAVPAAQEARAVQDIQEEGDKKNAKIII